MIIGMEEYNEKLNRILSDENKFTRITEDPRKKQGQRQPDYCQRERIDWRCSFWDYFGWVSLQGTLTALSKHIKQVIPKAHNLTSVYFYL